jgi:F-box-like
LLPNLILSQLHGLRCIYRVNWVSRHRKCNHSTNVEVSRPHFQRATFQNSFTPICSLPPEILSWIFELGQAIEISEVDDFDTDGVSLSSFEVLISQICSHFRTVALDTHKLWRSFDISRLQSLESFTTYISRSGGCGLRVRLDFDGQAPSTAELVKLDAILPYSGRYNRLIIDTVDEPMDNPIIRHFRDREAPMLEYLSISVEEVEGTTAANTGVFLGGAEKLSFVRLRGLAIPLFRPPLNSVTTLHLEQTSPLPIQFTTFLQILTASPCLIHLSVYGDIVGSLTWPGTLHPINLPNLRSLRICGISGMIYSGLLLGINAACLDSLVLKDAQEFDLDIFWASPDVFKFPQLHHLTFCDFEFSSHAYIDVFRAFPMITKFTVSYSPTTPMILSLLAQPTEVDIPWPNLHTLTFLLNIYDDDLMKNVVRNREAAGCPLVKLQLGTSLHPSALRQYSWLQENVLLEKIEKLENWPATDFHADEDDVLFY